MSKRTRNRQLARVAARRYAEKRHQKRRRMFATVAVVVVVALAGGVAAYALIWGDDEPPAQATGTPSPSVSESPEPGVQTGTVSPTAGPEQVACEGSTPRGALRPKPQFNAPADVLEPGQTYTATFRTSCGDIVVELLAEEAPETVNSFVFLSQEGYFDATRIHRLDDSIDVIQGGDPTGTGQGGPGYTIPGELTGEEVYGRGTLAMANSGTPDSGGSQFFLITGPDGHFLESNATYTIFGRVIEGLDVAQRIQQLPIADPDLAAAGDISGQQPRQAVYIERVRIEAGETS